MSYSWAHLAIPHMDHETAYFSAVSAKLIDSIAIHKYIRTLRKAQGTPGLSILI